MTTDLKGWGLERNPDEGSSVGSGSLGTDLNSNVFTSDAMKRKNSVSSATAHPNTHVYLLSE